MNTYTIYKNLPRQIQNLLCSIHGFKLKQERYGKHYEEIYSALLKSDTWSIDQINKYKEEHLFKTIENAYDNCPYYTQLYKAHGVSPSSFTGLDSLEKFPLLTKEMVRENWKGMISNKFNTKDLIPYHTSGSTGKPLDFYWTKYNLQFYWATVWRGRARFGIYNGDKHLNFTGKIVVPIGTTQPPFWRFNKPLNQYLINMQHLTKDKITCIAQFINENKFPFFVGYPSIINSLASLIEEEKYVINHAPDYIFTSAEKVYPNQQSIIERALKGAKIIEHYGFSENAASASKCTKYAYHEDFELGHLELINTHRIGDDISGSLVATGFKNSAMPFIRYNIGDTATFSEKKCDCGLHSQVITEIEGRNEDYVITPEGANIMRFDYIFKNTDTLKECQIIQRELGAMIVRVVKRDNYNSKTEESLIQAIRECISPTIKIEFEYVDYIPRTKAGKFKAVISEINKQ